MIKARVRGLASIENPHKGRRYVSLCVTYMTLYALGIDFIFGLKDHRQYLASLTVKPLWSCVAAVCLNLWEEASEYPAQ